MTILNILAQEEKRQADQMLLDGLEPTMERLALATAEETDTYMDTVRDIVRNADHYVRRTDLDLTISRRVLNEVPGLRVSLIPNFLRSLRSYELEGRAEYEPYTHFRELPDDQKTNIIRVLESIRANYI